MVTAGIELSTLQMRAAFRRIGYVAIPSANEVIPADHCLKFWAVMLIDKLKFLAPEQRALLADEIVAGVTGLGDLIQAGTTQTPMVVIADSRYATWHNRVGWLDLTNGETLAAPLTPPLETVGYNLAVLFHRNRTACEELTRRKVTKDAQTSDP